MSAPEIAPPMSPIILPTNSFSLASSTTIFPSPVERDDRRQLVVRQAAIPGDDDMRIELIGRAEMRAGDQDRDLAYRRRQRGIAGQRLHQRPDGTAEFRLLDPRIPRPHQGTVLADRDK